MCVGSSMATTPGSMSVTRTSGSSSWRRDSDHPLRPHFVAAKTPLPARAVRPATEDGDDVAAGTAGAGGRELLEEHLGGGAPGQEPHAIAGRGEGAGGG